jgi:isocitrate dehydrogenase
MSLSTLSFQPSTRPQAAQLLAVQSHPVDIGGYYQPDDKKASAALRPSATLNQIVASL